MNNYYLLSIDPSIKNTGFTLWENKKPIWISEYNFKNYNINNFNKNIINKINIPITNDFNNLNLCIEQGFIHLGKGKETLEHLRGFIAGQFNKLITKDMLVHNLTWKKWYKDNFDTYWDIKNEKWDKYTSLAVTQCLQSENNWNIEISNHDQAESLLIGWYYLNKENK